MLSRKRCNSARELASGASSRSTCASRVVSSAMPRISRRSSRSSSRASSCGSCASACEGHRAQHQHLQVMVGCRCCQHLGAASTAQADVCICSSRAKTALKPYGLPPCLCRKTMLLVWHSQAGLVQRCLCPPRAGLPQLSVLQEQLYSAASAPLGQAMLLFTNV